MVENGSEILDFDGTEVIEMYKGELVRTGVSGVACRGNYPGELVIMSVEGMDLSYETACGRVLTVGGDGSELFIEGIDDVGTLRLNENGVFGGIWIRFLKRLRVNEGEPRI